MSDDDHGPDCCWDEAGICCCLALDDGSGFPVIDQARMDACNRERQEPR